MAYALKLKPHVRNGSITSSKCLKMVLERLVAAGLTLNPEKCVFCKPEVGYLGFFG